MTIAPPARPTLQRRIGIAGFFALAFGSMIGVGWVTALGSWLTDAGPIGASIGFLLGGLLMFLIGLCYAEVTAMLPVAGGEVAYAWRAFGTGKAYVVGGFLAFGYLSVSAFEAISVGRVVSHLFPGIDRWPLYAVGTDTVYGAHLLLAVVCTAAITLLNYRGVQWAARAQTVLTVAFLAVTAVFVGAALWTGALAHLQPAFVGDGFGGVAGGIAAVFVTAPFWFVGFDTIPQGAEEAMGSLRPRTLGLLILASIVCAALFYGVLIVAVSMLAPWQQTAAADLPTAAAFRAAFQGHGLADLVLVAALLGLLTSWNGFFLAGSRVLFALGRGRIIPAAFGRSHPDFGTPSVAVLFSGACTAAGACLGRGAIVAFIDVGSFCIAIAFLGVALSTARLRQVCPDLPRPYRAPGGVLVPRLAALGACFVLAVMVVPGSPAALVWPLEVLILAGVLVLGAVLWQLGAAQRRATSEGERGWLVLGEFAPQPSDAASA